MIVESGGLDPVGFGRSRRRGQVTVQKFSAVSVSEVHMKQQIHCLCHTASAVVPERAGQQSGPWEGFGIKQEHTPRATEQTWVRKRAGNCQSQGRNAGGFTGAETHFPLKVSVLCKGGHCFRRTEEWWRSLWQFVWFYFCGLRCIKWNF